MHDPIAHALLCIAHTLETHHGLVFEYADGSLADTVQRLDFAQDHAYLTQALQAIAPEAVPLLHPLQPLGATDLAAPFSPDAGFPLPSCPGA